MTHISGEANDTIEAMLIAEAMRLERTRQRHNRESAAMEGGMYGTSRESVRKAKKLKKIAPELAVKVRNGAMSLEAAYREATDDRRVALYLKLDPVTDDRLRQVADITGKSRAQLVTLLIEQFLDVERVHGNGWVL